MRRLFFFLLLGILMCAGGINKSEPKKCKEQNVSVDPLDLYRAPGPSVTFEPDLWEHRDERWGAWRDRNTPPTNTRARARRLSGMIVSVPIGWMVGYITQPLHQSREGESEWPTLIQGATPPFPGSVRNTF